MKLCKISSDYVREHGRFYGYDSYGDYIYSLKEIFIVISSVDDSIIDFYVGNDND